MFNNIIDKEKIKNFPDEILVCELKINPIEKKRKFKLEIYDHDAKIIREDKDTIKKPRKGGGLKKSITKFSKKSSKNLKFHMNNSKVKFSNMITLTYPSEYSNNGVEIKYHLNRFTKFLKLKKCEYTWIIEFQKRGAPHFHLLTDTYIDKKEVSQAWYDIVNSGDEKHLIAGTKCERLRLGRVGAKSYVRKYINKSDQKEVPEEYKNVGRFWGHSDTEYNKETLEIDQEETINIKAKYELFLRNVIKPKKDEELDFNWLYEGKIITLWNFKNQVLNEIKTG
jgi:hypothetical protein